MHAGPFLCKAVTIARFLELGLQHVLATALKRTVTALTRFSFSARVFIIIGCRLSGPAALLMFNEFSCCMTSLSTVNSFICSAIFSFRAFSLIKTEANDSTSKSSVSLWQVVVCPLGFRKQDTVLFYFFLFLRYAKNLLGFCLTFLANLLSVSDQQVYIYFLVKR